MSLMTVPEVGSLGYGDGTRYGSTFWECSAKMRPAFAGIAWDNRTVIWR